MQSRRRALAVGSLVALVASVPATAAAQDAKAPPAPAEQKKMKDDNRFLATTSLSGQVVIVVPLAQTRIAPEIAADSTQAPWRGGPTTLLAADSVLSEILTERAAAVRWVKPLEVKRMAKRAAGFIPPADQLGQAQMHPQGMKVIPDPLRSSLEKLAGLAGGRYALVPALLILTHDSTGVQAIYSAAVGDPRTGTVLWHTFAHGSGANANAAVHAAFDAMIPRDPNAP